MSHCEFLPCPELANDIRCFWTSEESPDEFNLFPVMPDSYIELIFNCGAPIYMVRDGQVEEAPSIFLLGLQQQSIPMYTQGTARIVSVRFYAWSARPLLQSVISLPELSLVSLDLDNSWYEIGRTLRDLMGQSNHRAAIACVQSHILDLYRRMNDDLILARTVGEMLYATQGQISMSVLSEHTYLSPSQFQRRMKQAFGLPAKTYARLIRYESARNSLLSNPSRPIMDIVHDFGYTDQSHLIHEFKAFTGFTPGELAVYRQQKNFIPQNAGLLQYP